MKLIDADLFLEEISKGATVEDLKKLVTECKGVPVTEVVHCKDCTHRYQHDSGRYFCEMYYGMGDVSDENYCSFGEKREA